MQSTQGRPDDKIGLGLQIRSARERLGWSHEDLSGRTGIATHFLVALEDEAFEIFRSDLIALQTNLRVCGRKLGLSSDVIEQYAHALNQQIKPSVVPIGKFMRG